MDQEKMADGVSLFLAGLGVDLTDCHLIDTPARVARAWATTFGVGYVEDLDKMVVTTFAEECDSLIVVKDIPFLSYCAHHIVPFYGTAKIGYLPGKSQIVGLSKLARILDHFANRLQVQERLTFQTANYIFKRLGAVGVGVVVTAEHLCMSSRGVKKPGAKTVTSTLLGQLRDDKKSREEFLAF